MKISKQIALLTVALANTACNTTIAQPAKAIDDTFNCPNAPALPAVNHRQSNGTASTKTIHVSSTDALHKAINTLTDHTTIIIAPGQYHLKNTLVIKKNHITIRGEKPDCLSTELIGKGMENADYDGVPHGIWSNATNLTVAHLTIRDVYQHTLKFNATADAPRVYQCRLLDSGKQFIKASPQHYGKGVNKGRVEHSIMAYTQHPPNTNHGGGTGYTNGVDVHAGHDWLVDGNIFMNFHTPDNSDHLWNPAVLFWNGAQGTITENNLFINVDRAIAYGLVNRRNTNTNTNKKSQKNKTPSNKPAGDYDHIGGIIRNNMITLDPKLFSAQRQSQSDASILIWDSPNTKVLHNTILNQLNHHFAIEIRFDTHNAEIKNNWSDARIHQRRPRRGNPPDNKGPHNNQVSDNHFTARAQYFVSPKTGDLHLTDIAANYWAPMVPAHPDATMDIDGDARPAPQATEKPDSQASTQGYTKMIKTNNIAGADQPAEKTPRRSGKYN